MTDNTLESRSALASRLVDELKQVRADCDRLRAENAALVAALEDTVNHHLDDGPCWCPIVDQPMPAHAACLGARAALAAHAARTEGPR